MHPRHWAAVCADKPAVIATHTGERISYRELNERSVRCANLMRRAGLFPGDHVALLMENHPRFLEIAWAAQRAGLYFTPISWRLQPEEAGYVLAHSGAKALFTSAQQLPLCEALPAAAKALPRFMVGGEARGYVRYEAAIDACPRLPTDIETRGADMLYSSGSTGRPKAVKVPVGRSSIDGPGDLYAFFGKRFGWDESTVYLMPAPLYHSGPLRFAMAMGYFGGTLLLMDRFDALESLRLCERYRVTHAQWVPTMMVRLLKLPPESRTPFDLSSLRFVIHGAAPVSVETKRAMIDWLGPILEEAYSGTEGNGATLISSAEWLAHPGSVGKAVLGTIHVLDEHGNELAPRHNGLIWFDGPRFEYYKEPERTAQAYNERGWSTLGDIGYLDEEGYLYLTDRNSDVIITGGVNVYPIEIEHVLSNHPQVLDAAVFGIPDEEMGELICAVVQPKEVEKAGPELARELSEFCRSRLARYKCPRRIEWAAELPRHDTGKLYKRLLRDRYVSRRGPRP